MTQKPLKTARQLRAEWQAEIARREAEIAAAEREEERRVGEALRRAGRARVAAVETLYEMLAIGEETTTRTRADGTVQTVRADRDETERAERLVAAVAALVEATSGTRSAAAGDAGALTSLPPAASDEDLVQTGYGTDPVGVLASSSDEDGWAA